MSSPAQPKVLLRHSLYVWVLLAMVGILSTSFIVFRAISQKVQAERIDPVYDQFDELQLESARAILQRWGQDSLAGYMHRLDGLFSGSHYLLDGNGKDLVSGVDRSDMLPKAPAVKSREAFHGHWEITHRSADGKFWFAAEGSQPRWNIRGFLPYYFLVIGATGILCWIAAAGVISPIRRIANSIAQFGQGDLSVRVETDRPDEIGQLSRSFNDMAERMERLITSERRLLSDISHELRSPLARLKFAMKLARTSSDPAAALERIERDVNRIASLVSDIVAINGVEDNPALGEQKEICIRDIIDEVTGDCSLEAQARGCRIVVSGDVCGQVHGNPELLRRAVENIVRNAIRYSPEKTAVEVTLSEDQSDAHITVRDYGPGVPDQAMERIFDPFFRVEEARNTNGGGSGLGLSIAKRAVRVHRGEIVAKNATPGLRVNITIPLTRAIAHVS
ncbi:ATP-binding protein [Occallatibacter savannae]|uniref:ATP-binding protein n=1 Tax=Occallatibacter savannae TaxID=1002691 RepID=UPI000D687743|nr:ATP-binding protein [Occallatibacter savannae]